MQSGNHLSEEQVAQCADAIISGQYKILDEKFRRHLIECDECAAEVLNVTDVVVDLKEVLINQSRFRIKPWIISVSSVAAIGLVFFIITYLTNPENSNQTAGIDSPKIDTDTTSITPKTNQIAENLPIIKSVDPVRKDKSTQKKVSKKSNNSSALTPNQDLEILFNNFTQAYRGDDISVLSTGVVNVPQVDSLKWLNPKFENLSVEIYSNTGEKVLFFKTNSTSIALPLNLESGIYYWKLINSDFDLLFVGKLRVE